MLILFGTLVDIFCWLSERRLVNGEKDDSKIFSASVVAVLLVLGPAALAQQSPTEVAGATLVDVVAAKSLFDRGAKFIDVRGDNYWKLSHIPRSISLDAITKLNAARRRSKAKFSLRGNIIALTVKY